MDRSELVVKILDVIKKHTGVIINKDQYDCNLIDLGIDSVNAVEMANEMEDILDDIIDDRDIVKFVTVNRIVDYLQEKING